jgi:cardiolipin synthase
VRRSRKGRGDGRGSDGSPEMKTPPPGTSATRVLTLPNTLSILRLATVPVFVWLFATGRADAAVILYAVGAWTDFFDGYIARRTNSVTELGKLLDPLADRVFIVALAVALVAADVLPLWLALAIVVRDALVLSLFPALERRGVPRIPVSFVGKCATASLLLGLTLLAWSETRFPLHEAGFELGFTVTLAGAALYWWSAFMYAREAARGLREPNRRAADRGRARGEG